MDKTSGSAAAWVLIFAVLAVMLVGACAFGLALAVAGGAW